MSSFCRCFHDFFFIENMIQKNALLDLRQYIVDFYALQQKEKQESLERIIRSAIGNKLVEVDTILKEISSYEVSEDVFAPTQDNIKEGTWKCSPSSTKS
jgi:BMFP domain-containing protein YqiC